MDVLKDFCCWPDENDLVLENPTFFEFRISAKDVIDEYFLNRQLRIRSCSRLEIDQLAIPPRNIGPIELRHGSCSKRPQVLRIVIQTRFSEFRGSEINSPN